MIPPDVSVGIDMFFGVIGAANSLVDRFMSLFGCRARPGVSGPSGPPTFECQLDSPEGMSDIRGDATLTELPGICDVFRGESADIPP